MGIRELNTLVAIMNPYLESTLAQSKYKWILCLEYKEQLFLTTKNYFPLITPFKTLFYHPVSAVLFFHASKWVRILLNNPLYQ